MFYVPQRNNFPKQKPSLKFINKIQQYLKCKKEIQHPYSHKTKTKYPRQRFKTACENADATNKVSLPCKKKKSMIVVLPQIFEKRFFLKGKVTGHDKQKSKSTHKIEPSIPTVRTGRTSHRQPKKKKKQLDQTLANYQQILPWQNTICDED